MRKIIILLVMSLLLSSCTTFGAPEVLIVPQTTIITQKKIDFEINDELNLFSLVAIEKGTIKEDEIIDTSVLGLKKIDFNYINDSNEEKEYSITINIVDTQKPLITCKKEITTIVGTKIDLLKDVKVSDNSNEVLKVQVEGSYNFDRVGVYKLKYIAADSSGNVATVAFTLVVKENKVDATPELQTPQTNISSLMAEILRLTNIEREKAGIAPLKLGRTSLQTYAAIRAEESYVLFSHTRPNGEPWNTVVTDLNCGLIGENLAKGQRTPQEAVQGWMGSIGHKENILRPEFTEMGVGVYVNNGVYYWVQFFAGVCYN